MRKFENYFLYTMKRIKEFSPSLMTPLYSFLYGKKGATEKWLDTFIYEDWGMESRRDLENRRRKYECDTTYRIVVDRSEELELCKELFDAVYNKLKSIIEVNYDDDETASKILSLLKMRGLKYAIFNKKPFRKLINEIEEFPE